MRYFHMVIGTVLGVTLDPSTILTHVAGVALSWWVVEFLKKYANKKKGGDK